MGPICSCESAVLTQGADSAPFNLRAFKWWVLAHKSRWVHDSWEDLANLNPEPADEHDIE